MLQLSELHISLGTEPLRYSEFVSHLRKLCTIVEGLDALASTANSRPPVQHLTPAPTLTGRLTDQ